MDGGADGPGLDARFVADRRPALLGTALLLTGDRGAAEELVQRALTRALTRAGIRAGTRALTRAGTRAGTGDPEQAVLRAVVRGSTSRWARLTRSEQVIDTFPDPFAGPAGDERPDLSVALRELPPRTRAVVVLRWHESLPDARTAVLLGCPVPAVVEDAARALEALRPALAPSVYERSPGAVPLEQRLSEALARLAAEGAPWRLDAEQSLADVRARRRTARRRLAACAVTALVLGGVAVPLARWAPDPPPPAAVPSSPGARPPPIAPRAVPVLTGPTRGSLAGDPAVVEALRSAGWGSQEAPAPGDREVLLATDTPSGRVALVVGTVLEDFRGVWLTGPVGAPAEDLVPHLPHQLGRDRPLLLLLGGPGDSTLLVVAAPGDEVAVSDRLMTGPRGTVGRTYLPVDTADGVAVVPARTTGYGSAVSVRVSRAGREVYRGGADWPDAPPAAAAPLPGLPPLRPGPGVPDPYVVGAAVTDLAVPLGVDPPALQPRLLWAADLPLDRGTGGVAVLVGYSPGGALVVTTWAGIDGRAVACGTQTPPGTTEVATLSVARVCEVPFPAPERSGDGRWLVVTAPPDAASAELLDTRGRVLGPLALAGGGAVVPLPDGARAVRTLDADGRLLQETPIAPTPTEPFGNYGPGPAR